jgi:hypothetical protein
MLRPTEQPAAPPWMALSIIAMRSSSAIFAPPATTVGTLTGATTSAYCSALPGQLVLTMSAPSSCASRHERRR